MGSVNSCVHNHNYINNPVYRLLLQVYIRITYNKNDVMWTLVWSGNLSIVNMCTTFKSRTWESSHLSIVNTFFTHFWLASYNYVYLTLKLCFCV